MPALILYRPEFRNPRLDFLEQLPRLVRAAVIDHDDFMRDILELEFQVQVFNGGTDAALLVTRRNDDGHERERAVGRGAGVHESFESSSHPGFASACRAISSKICSREICGRQSHAFSAWAESSTSQGTSKGRASALDDTGWEPNR